MATSASIQVHFKPGDVSHRHYPGSFSVLDIGERTPTSLNVHFGDTAMVDEVIAELVALRAEMTGDPAAPVKAAPTEPHRVHLAPNPPYHVTGHVIGETACGETDSYFICNSQDGHDGPQHVAYGPGSEECHRWPVATPAATLDAALADARAQVADVDPLPANEVPAGTSTAVRF